MKNRSEKGISISTVQCMKLY